MIIVTLITTINDDDSTTIDDKRLQLLIVNKGRIHTINSKHTKHITV